MFTSEFAICFMTSAVSTKALLKFWIAVSVSAFICAFLRRAPPDDVGRCARGDQVNKPRAPDLAPERERPPELDTDDGPRLRAPARVQHHAQQAVDAEPGVSRAGHPVFVNRSSGQERRSLEKQHHAEREPDQQLQDFPGLDVESLTRHCRPLRVSRTYRKARRHNGSAGCGAVTGGGVMLYWRTSPRRARVRLCA